MNSRDDGLADQPVARGESSSGAPVAGVEEGGSSSLGISAGDLVISLHETWGSSWLADRLLGLAGWAERDWLELKATLCPPTMQIYAADRGGHPKETKGDHYLNVVRAVVALANGHGGAILLGIAEKRGSQPDAVPEDALCESKKYAPVPILPGSVNQEWDVDAWMLYVRDILRRNEWTDRYGTVWSCSAILDDPHLRLLKSRYRQRPVIVIAVFPAEDGPLELTRRVPVGRGEVSVGQRGPDHCVRRAQHGGGCHWPHDDPTFIYPTVIPFRVRGDFGSNDMRWSFRDVSFHWRRRQPRQERFAAMASAEKNYFRSLPVGLTPALEAILARTGIAAAELLGNLQSVAEARESVAQGPAENGRFLSTFELIARESPRTRSAWMARAALSQSSTYRVGDRVPVLATGSEITDSDLLAGLAEDPERFVLSGLLPRLGGAAAQRSQWDYIAREWGIHLYLDAFDALEAQEQLAFARALRVFRKEYSRLAVTIAGDPRRLEREALKVRIGTSSSAGAGEGPNLVVVSVAGEEVSGGERAASL